MKELDAVGYARFMMLSDAIQNAKKSNTIREKLGLTSPRSIQNQIQSSQISSELDLVDNRRRPEAVPDSRPSQFRRDSSSEEEVKAQPSRRH